VLNNSGYLDERMLCKDMALAYNDIAAWNNAEIPHALGCQGGSPRVSTPVVSAAYIESFYNIR
jgi:indolepyruvate decarboxylase